MGPNKDAKQWADAMFPQPEQDEKGFELESSLRAICVEGASYRKRKGERGTDNNLPTGVNWALQNTHAPNRYLKYFLKRATMDSIGGGPAIELIEQGGAHCTNEYLFATLLSTHVDIDVRLAAVQFLLEHGVEVSK